MIYSVKEIRALVNEAINEIKFPDIPAELYAPIRYLMELEGKRFRPCLLLLAKNLFSDELHSALPQAMGLEFFHTFTLIHDDIMDNAPLRRGMPTVHEKWNANTAILSGDVMFVEAFEQISACETIYIQQVLKVFNKMARQVCEGQQLDMNFESREEVSIAEYLHMIELKTAVLLGCALQIGAVLGNATQDQALHLYHFGRYMGIAFQLKDDLLDVYGSPDVFGKQVGGDILANKKTFLLLKALEVANTDLLEELQFLLTVQSIDPAIKISRVRAVYDALSIRELAEEAISHYSAQALTHLHALDLPEQRKETLATFCYQFSKRES